MNAKDNRTSYAIRAVIIAGLALLVYIAAFLLLADLKKGTAWIGFGFAVLALVLTGGGLWVGIQAADSLRTAVNIYEALQPLWLYPVLAVVLSIVSAILPSGSWKLITLLEVVLLAGAAAFAIIGSTAAARMTELDKNGKKGKTTEDKGEDEA